MYPGGVYQVLSAPVVAASWDELHHIWQYTRMSFGCQLGPVATGCGANKPVGGVTEAVMSKNCSCAGMA